MENCSRGRRSVATLLAIKRRLQRNNTQHLQKRFTDVSVSVFKRWRCRRDGGLANVFGLTPHDSNRRVTFRTRRPERNLSHLRTPPPRRSLRSRANEAEILPAAVQTGGIKVAPWLREALGTRGFNPCRSLKCVPGAGGEMIQRPPSPRLAFLSSSAETASGLNQQTSVGCLALPSRVIFSPPRSRILFTALLYPTYFPALLHLRLPITSQVFFSLFPVSTLTSPPVSCSVR